MFVSLELIDGLRAHRWFESSAQFLACPCPALRFGDDDGHDGQQQDLESEPRAPDQPDEAGPQEPQLRKGKAKVVHNMLGLLQSLVLRREGENQAEIVQLCQAASVLPKANTATIRSRFRKWSPFTSHGCSEHFGGQSLEVELSKLKLVGIVCLFFASLGTKFSFQVFWRSCFVECIATEEIFKL